MAARPAVTSDGSCGLLWCTSHRVNSASLNAIILTANVSNDHELVSTRRTGMGRQFRWPRLSGKGLASTCFTDTKDQAGRLAATDHR